MDSPHTLITCNVNKGAADEVMDAARAAGATGGTILIARGTGKEEDVRFFGIQLVPEKEMLLLLVGSGQTGAVLNAIRKVPCLAEPARHRILHRCRALHDPRGKKLKDLRTDPTGRKRAPGRAPARSVLRSER